MALAHNSIAIWRKMWNMYSWGHEKLGTIRVSIPHNQAWGNHTQTIAEFYITLVHDSRKRKKNKKKTWLLLWKNYHSAFSFYLGYRTLLKFSCIIPKSKGMSMHGIGHFHGLSPRHEHAKKLYDTGFREIAVIPLPLKSFILIMDHRRSKFHQHNWKKKYSLLHCNIQFQKGYHPNGTGVTCLQSHRSTEGNNDLT